MIDHSIDDNLLEKFSQRLQVKNPENAIRIAVKRFLKKFNSEGQIPVPLTSILNKIEVEIQHNPNSKDAVLSTNHLNRFVIHLNKSQDWKRQRFSIAHELAHIIIYMITNDNYVRDLNSSENRKIEKICNIGASELLIPNDYFFKIFNPSLLSVEYLKELQRRFLTSYEVLFSKINSSYPQIGITLWKKIARNQMEEEQFRVVRAFHRYSKEMKYPWLPNGCTIKHVIPNNFVDKKLIKEEVLDKVVFKLNKNSQFFSKAISFEFDSLFQDANALKIEGFDKEYIDSKETLRGSKVLIVYG